MGRSVGVQLEVIIGDSRSVQLGRSATTTALIQELGSSFFEEAMQQPEAGVALPSRWLNLNCVQTLVIYPQSLAELKLCANISHLSPVLG